MKNNLLKGRLGFSILEVIIALGLFSVVAVSVGAFMSQQSKQVKIMSQKIAVNDLKNGLLTTMQDPTVCAWNLGGLTFDSTAVGTKSITLPRIRSSAAITAPLLVEANLEILPGSGLSTETIKLDDLVDVGGGKWQGIWKLKVRNDVSTFQFKDIMLNPQIFVVDSTVPAAARIVSCLTVSGGSPSYWSTGNSIDIFYNGGKIGMGTAAPRAKLDVAAGQVATAVYDAGVSAAIDFDHGNTQISAAPAGTITFANTLSGGSYSIILTNGIGGNYTLSAAGFSFRCQPACPGDVIVVNPGTQTVVNILATNSVAYVSWIRGF